MDTTLSDFYDIVSPDAGAMIESLRAYGYHLDTAVADIIDNSISAGAKTVWIDCIWNGEKSTVSIRDDGNGMTDIALKNAMRPGSRNPLQKRDLKDLGRFGLGLKTASFSQCRKLTVGSKTEVDDPVFRCWDLDYINSCGEWRLLKPDKEKIPPVFTILNEMNHGTIILWENLDRLTKGEDPDNRKQADHFYAQLDILKAHLEMIFHRFLEKINGLKIFLNDRQLKPWDPFLTNYPSTQCLPVETIFYNGEKIIVRPYVLPHRSKIDDDTYKNAGGLGGWNERQGFYVYRNERLIVPGDWLGLEIQKGQPIRKEQFTKLARIMVDLPNSLDEDWKIDVKKSVARPPNFIKEDFQRIARLTIEKAVSIYRFRGKVTERTKDAPASFPWLTTVQHGNYHYSINREYPLLSEILQTYGESRQKILTMLRIIEESVPIPLMVMNESNNPDKVPRPFESAPSDELKQVMAEVWSSMIRTGVPPENAKMRLMQMEPFSDYPDYVTEFMRKNFGK